MSKKARTRRQRRQLRAELRHGRSARPRHASPSGRIGHIRSKQQAPKHHERYIGGPVRSIAEAARCWCGAGPGELHRHDGH